MRKQHLHEWNLKQDEAKALQRELAKHVIREDRLDDVGHIAGVDMAINEISGMARAAVVMLSYPELEIVEQHVYEEPIRMPYILSLIHI